MSKEKNVKKPQFILWMRFIWAFLERQDRIWLKIINLEKVTCGFWFASFYVVCVQLCVYLCAMHWITLQKFLYHCNLTRRLDVRPLNTSRTSQNRISKICFIYIHFSYRTFYLDFNYLTTSVFFSSLLAHVSMECTCIQDKWSVLCQMWQSKCKSNCGK